MTTNSSKGLLTQIRKYMGQKVTQDDFEEVSKSIAQFWIDSQAELPVDELEGRASAVSLLFVDSIGECLTRDRFNFIQSIVHGAESWKQVYESKEIVEDWSELSPQYRRYREYLHKLVYKPALMKSPYRMESD